MSLSVESCSVLGPEQQSFHKGRHCEDNMFVLNSLLSEAGFKCLVSHLLFLDLKEAYHCVDPDTLYRKLL